MLGFLVVGLWLMQPAQGGKLEVVTPKADGIIATGINGQGDVVGFEWVEETKRPGVVEQKPFLARGKQITYLPLLKGYTATFPAAVSDDGLVVGRVSKPAPPNLRVYLRNQAFVWDARGGIRGIGTLEGDVASFACGVSRDGRRISGYSVGDERIRPCVWDRDATGAGWTATLLPGQGQLGSNTVAISSDGRRVAACDGPAPCLWTRDDAGAWKRETLGGPAELVPRAVNNAGTVVGLRFTPDGMTHAVIWTRGVGIKVLPKPPGYVKSEANAVNDAGVVVGMIDGPAGSSVGPDAFAYEGEKLRVITEGGPFFGSATAINDRGQVAGVLEKKEEPEVPAAAPRKPVAPSTPVRKPASPPAREKP